MENHRLSDWECVAAASLSFQVNLHGPKWTRSPNFAFNIVISWQPGHLQVRLYKIQLESFLEEHSVTGKVGLGFSDCACPLANCCGAKQRSTSLIEQWSSPSVQEMAIWPREFLLQPQDSWEEWRSPARRWEAEKGWTMTRFSCRRKRRSPRKKQKSWNRYKLR